MNITEILAQIKRPTATVDVILRGDLIAEWEELEREFRAANTALDEEVTASGRSARAAKIAAEMEAVRGQIAASVQVFRLEAAARPDWLTMIAAHKNGDGPNDVDENTFGVAIVAACCTDPVMTLEQAKALRDTLSDGQWERIGNEVMALNRTNPGVPWSQAASIAAALGT